MTITTLGTLPPMDVAGRIPRLRERFAGAEVDALLVTRLPNVRYLTGFTGSAGMVLVTPTDALLVTDGRYQTQSAEQVVAAGADARVGIGTTQARQREILGEAAAGTARLGLEAQGVSWAQQRSFAEWFPGAELVPTEHLVEDFRMVKDAGEVARVRAPRARSPTMRWATSWRGSPRRRPSATSRSSWSWACASAGRAA